MEVQPETPYTFELWHILNAVVTLFLTKQEFLVHCLGPTQHELYSAASITPCQADKHV